MKNNNNLRKDEQIFQEKNPDISGLKKKIKSHCLF
jgi:hypothetical protein